MRCNVGVNPKYLTDQWLIAEYRELPMVVGQLRKNEWTIKSPVKDSFDLGKGHMNWFKMRLLYLHRRHVEVKIEMATRNFKHDLLSINENEIPCEFWNDWIPTIADSIKIRHRLMNKIVNNDNVLLTWWRFNGVNLSDGNIEEFLRNILCGELYPV